MSWFLRREIIIIATTTETIHTGLNIRLLIINAKCTEIYWHAMKNSFPAGCCCCVSSNSWNECVICAVCSTTTKKIAIFICAFQWFVV